MVKKKYNVLDLFCGCGGLSLGFENAGFNVLLGIDMWEDALVTYRRNHKNGNTLCADLASLPVEEVDKAINHENVDVIIGGPPCQGFSIAGKRIVDDDRNKLYKSFVRMVAYFKPKAFVLENVPNILSIGEGAVREAIIKDFSELGYKVTYKVLLAADYGVPQNRRRAIFVGMLDGKEFIFPEPTVNQPVTSKEARRFSIIPVTFVLSSTSTSLVIVFGDEISIFLAILTDASGSPTTLQGIPFSPSLS